MNLGSSLDFYTIDEASRGPFGSFNFLLRMKGRTILAAAGAIIILAFLAVEPFTQQVLSYPFKPIEATGDGIATVPRMQFWTLQPRGMYLLNRLFQVIDFPHRRYSIRIAGRFQVFLYIINTIENNQLNLTRLKSRPGYERSRMRHLAQPGGKLSLISLSIVLLTTAPSTLSQLDITANITSNCHGTCSINKYDTEHLTQNVALSARLPPFPRITRTSCIGSIWIVLYKRELIDNLPKTNHTSILGLPLSLISKYVFFQDQRPNVSVSGLIPTDSGVDPRAYYTNMSTAALSTATNPVLTTSYIDGKWKSLVFF